MVIPKDYKYGESVHAQVHAWRNGTFEVRTGSKLRKYNRIEDLPVKIRKAMALLMISPETEYIEGVGRVMGSNTFWVYSPKRK